MSWLSNFIGSRYTSSVLFDSVPFKPLVIEPLSLEELDELVCSQDFEDSTRDALVSGFSLLRKDVASRRLHLNRDDVYSLDAKLHPFEYQAEQKKRTCEYDLNFVARSNKELIGVVSLKWTTFHFCKHTQPSWLYFFRFIDVREDVRNSGICKDLLSFMANYAGLEHKILRFGPFKTDGEKYLKPQISKIFADAPIAIIPSDSRFFPQEEGCYFTKK